MPHRFPTATQIANKRGLDLQGGMDLRARAMRNQGIIQAGGATQAGLGLVGVTALALLAKPVVGLLAGAGAGALRAVGVLGAGTAQRVAQVPGLAGVGGALATRPVATGIGVLGAGAASAGVGLQLLGGGSGEQVLSPIGGSQNVAYSWNTGTAQFYRLIDGRIAVQKTNGVWKVYWPARHIVVPRNPRIGTLLKADRRIDRMMKGIHRRAGGHTKRGSRSSVPTQRVQLIKN